MRTACVALAIMLLGCGKKDAPTTSPDDATPAASDSTTADDDDYGDGSPVLVGDDKPGDLATSGPTIDTTVRTEGAVGPDEVEAAVRGGLDEVQACYQAAIRRTYNEDLAGVVAIEFEIDGKGKAGGAKVAANTLGDDQAGLCIAELVAKWKFPKPSDGKPVKVHFPFELGG